MGAAVHAQEYKAQQAGRMARIGFLSDFEPASEPNLRQLEDSLREHGYVAGLNLVLEQRFAEGRPERLSELAAELVRLQVDVIVAVSERGAVAAKQATTTIPIVMVYGLEPIRLGLINSLARPGGNVTGLVADPGPEIIAKRLQILRELVPGSNTIALLTEPATAGRTERIRPLEEAARKGGISLKRIVVQRLEDLPGAFEEITRAGAGALLVSGAGVLYESRSEISGLALKHKLPAIYPLRGYALAGGLMPYGVNSRDLYRRAGAYAARILKGATPRDLPVEQPMRFELIINLKTAKALGLTIPPSLLGRADEVIE
jgi:putative ABC transport system substrate-binding protein